MSMQNVSSRISQRTGVAPVSITALAVAMNVRFCSEREVRTEPNTSLNFATYPLAAERRVT